MADDVDPNQSLPTEAARTFEPVEIAMMEIEIVELEAVERELEPEGVEDPGLTPPAEIDTPEAADASDDAADDGADCASDDGADHAADHEQPQQDSEPEKVVLQVTTLDVVAVDEDEFDASQPELEVVEPDVDIEPDIEPVSEEPDDSMEPVEALPTMADLDRVASELDDIDARLAALDEQRP